SVVLADLDIIDPVAHARKREEALKPKIEHLRNTWHLTPEQVHIVSGPAQKVSPSVANRIKADVVVIGTTGKTGLAARVIGNTAEKVLTHLRTDLLAIKPAEENKAGRRNPARQSLQVLHLLPHLLDQHL